MLVTSSGYEKQANYSWYGTEEAISHYVSPHYMFVGFSGSYDLNGVLHSDLRCFGDSQSYSALQLLRNQRLKVHMSLEIIGLSQSLARAHLCRQTSFGSCHWVEGIEGMEGMSRIRGTPM